MLKLHKECKNYTKNSRIQDSAIAKQKKNLCYLANSWPPFMLQVDAESWRQPQKPSSSLGNVFGKGWSGITPTYIRT